MSQRLRPASVVLTAWLMLVASSLSAQTGASGIAGVVKDPSGAVLPGVTVEASSPALIEKFRSVVTDGQGQYKIVDLRPGVYTVTFTLTGFTAVKREGVELPVSFTATVNAELKVGSLEETITVSGQSPLVDVQNTAPRNVIAAKVLDSVPTAKAFTAYAALSPGVTIASTSQDVGGSKGDTMVWLTSHGSRTGDSKITVDGFETNYGAGARLFVPNPYNAEEISLDLGNGSAEARVSGVTLNFVPKSGGNTFSGDVFGTFTNDKFQNSNFSTELESRGLTASTLNRIDKLWDVNLMVGGPIKHDRLWFFASHRQWGGGTFVAGLFYNKTLNSFPPVYTPDTSRPALNDFLSHGSTVRLTWQASARNKVSLSYDSQKRCDCHRDITRLFSPEAVAERNYTPIDVVQARWTFVASNKLLFEGGVGTIRNSLGVLPQSDIGPNAIAILEGTTGFSYGAMFLQQENYYSNSTQWKTQPRFNVSYVTGSHAFKGGIDVITNFSSSSQFVLNNLKYTYRNGSPSSLQQFAMPYETASNLLPDLGLFVQDQWTVKRLTLNLGLRLDYQRTSIPAIHENAVQFRPVPVDLPAVSCAACLTDVEPRLSAAYNLFGDGKTALKVSVGRYASGTSAVTNNPAGQIVTSASRSWTDSNGNFIPDCELLNLGLNGECGPISNSRFGQPVPGTRLADDVFTGVRQYNWQASASVQHELMQGLSVNVAYYRTSWYAFTATDNQAVVPSNYDPYCITLATDPRLPNGGGNQLCGLYDITPSLFGKTDNVVTLASHYGNQSEVYNGVDASFIARFGNGATLSGGSSTGRVATDACFTIDSPQALLFCNVVPPFLTQFKMNGTYPLPWLLQVSGAFQSLPGIPVSASLVATNEQIAPSLGRPLSGTSNTVTIPNIITPQTMFEGRSNQLDVRLTRTFRVGRMNLRGHFDVYNVLNASPILAVNTTYGPSWLNATSVLDARLFKLSAQLSF